MVLQHFFRQAGGLQHGLGAAAMLSHDLRELEQINRFGVIDTHSDNPAVLKPHTLHCFLSFPQLARHD
jgi:hypothetical protein